MVTACLLGLIAISGCGNDGKTDVGKDRLKAMAGGQLKDVVVVQGVVNIDGSPAAGVNLFLCRDDNAATVVKECRTDENGKYCWTSYQACDGLEPGAYLLGFTHIPKPKKNGTGDDLLKGKYRDAKKNKIELKVEKGTPQEKADYDLKTK
jgi:5-hydroxyisourate hydrolase-like protein (transthyretin family)